jgi:ABC-type amino acid transport substrate-binding protein
LLALWMLSCAAAAPQATLRIARIEAIPDQLVGAAILEAIYRHLDIRLEFVDMPAKRALLESSEGRVDGEIQRVLDVGSEYPTLIAVRPSVNYIEPSAFVTRADFRVDGWRSVAPYSIGIVRGVGSSERGTKGMSRVEAVTTMDQLMGMLADGRVEVAVNDRFSGELVCKRLHLDATIHALSPAIERIPLYHFLNERHRDLVPRVEAVVREMTASGELERIRADAQAQLIKAAGR